MDLTDHKGCKLVRVVNTVLSCATRARLQLLRL